MFTYIQDASPLQKRGRGQGLVEYALIIVLVSVVVIAVLTLLGPTIGQVYSNVTNALGVGLDPEAPRINCSVPSNSPGAVNLEALVSDPQGDPITVVFKLDNTTTLQTEYHFHYCLNGTDSPCGTYTLPGWVSAGNHTITATASDGHGHTSQCTISVSK